MRAHEDRYIMLVVFINSVLWKGGFSYIYIYTLSENLILVWLEDSWVRVRFA